MQAELGEGGGAHEVTRGRGRSYKKTGDEERGVTGRSCRLCWGRALVKFLKSCPRPNCFLIKMEPHFSPTAQGAEMSDPIYGYPPAGEERGKMKESLFAKNNAS